MVKVSIIIVKFKAEKETRACLKSIPKGIETIVIDNNRVNRGFSKANNLGAARAKGKYLFFLNPDTLLKSNTISILSSFLDTHPRAAIVSPVLLDSNGLAYPFQGTEKLTPLSGLVCLSFINKLVPNNPISQKYWLRSWDKLSPKKVAVVPGTALLIRKSVFDQVGGFDQNFFLFFEESDLCKRVNDLGYEAWMLPKAKIIHHWGRSTPRTSQTQSIFFSSRYYYFKKHYGVIPALLVQLICRLGWRTLFGAKIT